MLRHLFVRHPRVDVGATIRVMAPGREDDEVFVSDQKDIVGFVGAGNMQTHQKTPLLVTQQWSDYLPVASLV